MTPLEKTIEQIEKARISYDRKHIVRIVAVSKYAQTAQIESLVSEGQRAFGENRVQDLEKKSAALLTLPIEWHFVGAIQSNKINKLLSINPAIIHSIDSLKLAKTINDRLSGRVQRALLQINSAKEAAKNGVPPEEAVDTYQEITACCPLIKLEGVMTIGAHTDDQKKIEKSFAVTYKIFDKLKNNGAEILSMGMSGDFELAIANGANLLRLGSVLFGR
ncbi:MAG: YggS family pyridoxal phosphate-dependent enzyme [Helicobacteraceae bacterium]|nr:YggS family pyridoxal phosphate-dependent enzyme [Helicobacteraceae bacterium]